MAPQDSTSGDAMAAQNIASYRVPPVYQTSEPKRMRVSPNADGGSGGGAGVGAGRSPSGSSSSSVNSKFTRAATGVPSLMTNKGSVYKAQRGKAVTAAMVKAKTPTTHRRRGRKGKSVYRGVCVTREGKWRAVIYKERKQLYLGVYESEVDAAKAHDRAARFHFAENAVCNFDNEHEADRQALLHKQRQLVEQHQVAEERAHQIALHGGGFVAGREEFDDLEEYHRGLEMEGASCSEEGEGDGGGDADGEGEGETEEDMPTFGETRSSRSLSTSSATSLSSSSMMSADEDAAAPVGGRGANSSEQQAGPHQQHRQQQEHRSAALSSSGGGVIGHGNNQHNVSYQLAQQYQSGVMAAAVAAAAAAGPTTSAPSSGGVPVGAGLHFDGSVNLHGQGGGASQHHHQHHRGISSGSVGDSDSDFTPVSAFFQDLEPTPLEGMGFPYAENLLGYEMQSWYNCQDNDLSPTSGGGLSEFVDSEPLITSQQQHQRGGMGVGWGFGDFGQPTRQGSNSSMSSSTSGFSTSDEDYVPSALPPLMGMCADP